MDDFAARTRAAMDANGMSLRGVARALHFDPAYLSRVLNGKQSPSPKLAEGLDNLLGTEGALASLAPSGPIEASITRPIDREEGIPGEIAHMETGAAHLLQHADRYGGDTVAPAAVQVWRTAQRKLDAGLIPDQVMRAYLSAVAEAAEVAGWLLFDAGQRESARAAFLESHMLAGHAGNRVLQWFALDMLAMLDVECGRPGEVLRIVDELLSKGRLPPRVALLARVRRGRALAGIGERQRAMADLDAARGALEESLSPRDPEWTWWVDGCEVMGHSGQALLSLDDPEAALPKLQYARERATPRGVMLYRVDLLQSYTKAKSWGKAMEELQEISVLLSAISSGRNRRMLRETLRAVIRDPGTPPWLTSLAHEVNEAARLSPAP